jgi:Nif-specific regulatory protein
VRIIAATNKSLEKLIQAGYFRPDLFYRLNIFTINIAPLRERREDILPIAHYFLEKYASEKELPVKRLSPKVKELLVEYDYPGNVRELRNIIERAIIGGSSDVINSQDIYLGEYQPVPTPISETMDKDNQDYAHILNALEKAKWNRRKAASLLGMPYSTLRYKLEKYNINK